jgi:translation initiation factor 4G
LHQGCARAFDIVFCEQVFDKALGEPNFSGIYARLCYDLNQVLPSFKVVDEDGKEEDIEFRRVLLNKCQLEFEEGGAAMRAVEAREKRQQEENAAMVRLPLDPNYLKIFAL